jgi:plastocyanin
MKRSIIALLLVVSACAEGGGTATTDGAAGTTPDGGSSGQIVISGFSFGSPQTVAVGTTVTVTNDDGVGHTWTSVDDLWDSGTLATGDEFSHTFEEAGTFSFICKIHSGQMGGSITVEG